LSDLPIKLAHIEEAITSQEKDPTQKDVNGQNTPAPNRMLINTHRLRIAKEILHIGLATLLHEEIVLSKVMERETLAIRSKGTIINRIHK
jgi:hypothetical protein